MIRDGKSAVIGLGLVAVVAGIIIATKAKAAPPFVYICPYCGEEFGTYEELLIHCEEQHGEEEVPPDEPEPTPEPPWEPEPEDH